MDAREFRRLRDGLIINLPPATDEVLGDAESKLRKRLESSAMFTAVEVECTSDPDRLLIGMVHYRPGKSERQVASYLEAVWITELRLPGLDAFHFVIEDGHVELMSVTGNRAASYFVTLHLIALEGTEAEFEAADAAAALAAAEAAALEEAAAAEAVPAEAVPAEPARPRWRQWWQWPPRRSTPSTPKTP